MGKNEVKSQEVLQKRSSPLVKKKISLRTWVLELKEEKRNQRLLVLLQLDEKDKISEAPSGLELTKIFLKEICFNNDT